MKKGLILIGFVFTLATAALAQPTVTLLTFAGYTFADKFDSPYGSGKIEDGFQWGGGFEFGMSDEMAVELIYQNMMADAYYDGEFSKRNYGTVGINYLMLGGTRYAPISDVVSGFGTLDLGVGWFTPSTSLASENVTKFSWGGRLGVRIQANEKVSIRLHGQMLSPVQWAGGGFYFGTGGAGAGVSTGSTIYQFNLGGSLNVRIK